jgi:uncharacterized cupredoxin-like copper-binding protein
MAARLIASTLCSLLLAGAANAAAARSLGIKLQDSSIDPSIAHMRLILDHTALKPGRVTVQADNQSKTLVHEVLIVRDDGAKELPFDATHNRVIENRVRRLGEITDLAPGRAGKLTVNLRPGTYVLFCNQPGHYKDGMVARVTVAP